MKCTSMERGFKKKGKKVFLSTKIVWKLGKTNIMASYIEFFIIKEEISSAVSFPNPNPSQKKENKADLENFTRSLIRC